MTSGTPEPGVAKLKYTSRSDNHDQMWEIEVNPPDPVKARCAFVVLGLACFPVRSMRFCGGGAQRPVAV